MIVTSSEGVADRSKLLRNYGQRENCASEIPATTAASMRFMRRLGWLKAWIRQNRRRRAVETYERFRDYR
jgi:hypothetical protein